jgi:adenylate cyclase
LILKQRKKLTVFFSDIQGFTEITDTLEAEQLSKLLNGYLEEMTKIALRYGGTIDKFIGDAIMIFLGDPDSKGEKEDALACAEMALEMRECMHHQQRVWQSEGVATYLRIRMGINTGFCTVGNFGSEARMDYTIIGRSVNLASRLESIAQADQILVSQETHALINDKIDCIQKDKIKVKGIAYPVQTFIK